MLASGTFEQGKTWVFMKILKTIVRRWFVNQSEVVWVHLGCCEEHGYFGFKYNSISYLPLECKTILSK